MALVIKQAILIDPRSAYNGSKSDILIENGKITGLGVVNASPGDQVMQQEGLCVSPGWTDCFSNFFDPGLEYKETLESGAAAAAAGGYCRVMVMPNTQPALHAKAQVEYVLQKSRSLPVTILPIGAISKNCEGKDLAEMYDMRQSGAVAFSDGTHPMQNSQIMTKALLYVKAFDGVIIQLPDEEALSKTGLMHEGVMSTKLGLQGKPALAESLLLNRDIELLRYTQSRLHVTGISTAASVALVRAAKQEGLQITCSVTPYHLTFCDEDLAEYDTNLKVNPPLRTRADVEALKAAVLDGTVDCIASHHLPHEFDSKVCEFEYAKYGMEGLESCMAAVRTTLPSLTAKQLVSLFAINPAKIFGLPLPEIAEGEAAMLTLFQFDKANTFEKSAIKSRSVNNAFVGREMIGKPLGIINNSISSILSI